MQFNYAHDNFVIKLQILPKLKICIENEIIYQQSIQPLTERINNSI